MNCPSCLSENEASASACAQCGYDFDKAATTMLVSVDLSPGAVFAGRYEIVRPLGKGGMGIVFLAKDRTLDEVVAIKLLRPDFGDNAVIAARFKSEIKLARRIRHRNVGAIHDFGEHRKLLYISMEFVEGVDLKQLLTKNGPFAPGEAYELSIQVAEALQAVHDAGIIHRDLKTPNIMRDSKGEARLMDFGIAKQHGIDGGTGTGNVVGTPEYMSPEQAQGHEVDYRSDIYALGIVMYELFSGQVPFRASTPIAILFKHLQEAPVLEGPDAPALPPTLIPVLRKCLEKDPANRYPSAREVAEALRQARSPSRRQERMPTDVLESPTVVSPRPAKQARVPPPAPDAPTRVSSPTRFDGRGVATTNRRWMLIVPVVLAAIALGVLLWSRREPDPTVAVASPTAEPTAAATAAPAPTAEVETPTPGPERTLPAVAANTTATPVRTAKPTKSPTPVREAAAPSPPPTEAPTAAPPADTGSGVLRVVAVPWADVLVDGKHMGTTPLDGIPLKAGSHKITLRYPTYENEHRTIVIRDGETERIRFDFPKDGKRKQ